MEAVTFYRRISDDAVLVGAFSFVLLAEPSVITSNEETKPTAFATQRRKAVSIFTALPPLSELAG